MSFGIDLGSMLGCVGVMFMFVRDRFVDDCLNGMPFVCFVQKQMEHYPNSIGTDHPFSSWFHTLFVSLMFDGI